MQVTARRPLSGASDAPTLSLWTPSNSGLCVSSGDRPSFDSQLDPADAQSISARQGRVPDALVVDKRAVGARKVDDLDCAVAGRETAVKPGHQRGVYDEICTRGAADRLDGSRSEPKCERV